MIFVIVKTKLMNLERMPAMERHFEEEMGEIEKKKKAFGIGNSLRISMEREVTENLSKSAAQQKELSAEYQLLQSENADLEIALKKAEDAYSNTFEQEEQVIASKLFTVLKVEQNDVFYTGQLLSSLFESLAFCEGAHHIHSFFRFSFTSSR
jgi:hypothetical protein